MSFVKSHVIIVEWFGKFFDKVFKDSVSLPTNTTVAPLFKKYDKELKEQIQKSMLNKKKKKNEKSDDDNNNKDKTKEKNKDKNKNKKNDEEENKDTNKEKERKSKSKGKLEEENNNLKPEQKKITLI